MHTRRCNLSNYQTIDDVVQYLAALANNNLLSSADRHRKQLRPVFPYSKSNETLITFLLWSEDRGYTSRKKQTYCNQEISLYCMVACIGCALPSRGRHVSGQCYCYDPSIKYGLSVFVHKILV